MHVRSQGPGMGRPIRPLLFALLTLLGAAPGFSQDGAATLAGRTVHAYNPVPGEALYVDLKGVGLAMAPVAGSHWVGYTFPDTLPTGSEKFGIRSAYGQANFWIGRTGISTTGADAFTVTDFGAGKSLWIVIDPSGPATAAPTLLTEAPKVVNVFNPWLITAPLLAFDGGTKKGMLTVPDDCGWFWAFLMKPAEHSFFLEEVNGADAYGSGGLGNRTPYNLAPEFAAKGSTLWLDTDINAWLPADPGKNSLCGYVMAATVRDFSQSHVDFDFGQAADVVVTGMVADALPPDRKPLRTAKTHQHFNQFDDWFNTKPGINEETCVDIPMTKTGDGLWMYDSYATPEHGFWPLDDFTTTAAGAANPHNQKNVASCYLKPDGSSWVIGGPMRNFNFCMESHATFIYQKGQKFSFRGDDDVWVYIDNKLAMDLGGVHTPKTDTIFLDQLNLVAGQTYNWDFYYCERQPCGSSLKIKTSIYFKQQRALQAVTDPAKSGTYKIAKYSGGTGACSILGSEVMEVPVPPGSLVYKLWSTSGVEVESLAEGSHHNGGIVIATPGVAVDTSKITGLPPGNYRIVAYEPANPRVRAEIPFTVRNRSLVEFEPPHTGTHPKSSLVRIVVANRAAGEVVPEASPYTLSIPAGLVVYRDSAKTLRITGGSTLMTGATGYDTLWVASSQDSTTDRSYTLSIPGSTRNLVLTFQTGSSIRARLGKASGESKRGPRRDALGRMRRSGRPILKTPGH